MNSVGFFASISSSLMEARQNLPVARMVRFGRPSQQESGLPRFLKVTVLSLLVSSALSVPRGAIADDEILVPAGPALIGCSPDDAACEADEGPPGGVTIDVPAFRIDTYEVTVDKFRACVKAGACTAPTAWFCNYVVGDHENHPMNCVDFNDAKAYCEYVHKRLPTEVEWEKAARDGATTPYPWGTAASCDNAIVNDEKTTGSSKESLDGCGEDNTFPVGTRKPNSLGLYDMNGNILEWTSTWYAPDAHTAYYAKGNLQGPPDGEKRVARGGSWDDKVTRLRSSYRDARVPSNRGGSLGFRCARGAK